MHRITLLGPATLVVLLLAGNGLAQQASSERNPLADSFRREPQWITGPRLLKLGETIDFEFYRPAGVAADDAVAVFPQYLERAEPGSEFQSGGVPGWIEPLKQESLPLQFTAGRATRKLPPEKARQLSRPLAGGRRDVLSLFRRD